MHRPLQDFKRRQTQETYPQLQRNSHGVSGRCRVIWFYLLYIEELPPQAPAGADISGSCPSCHPLRPPSSVADSPQLCYPFGHSAPTYTHAPTPTYTHCGAPHLPHTSEIHFSSVTRGSPWSAQSGRNPVLLGNHSATCRAHPLRYTQHALNHQCVGPSPQLCPVSGAAIFASGGTTSDRQCTVRPLSWLDPSCAPYDTVAPSAVCPYQTYHWCPACGLRFVRNEPLGNIRPHRPRAELSRNELTPVSHY